MSTLKSTRARAWASLMLLWHLVAILLPADVVSAEEQANGCGNTNIRAVHLAYQPASADEQVVIPKELVDRAAYAANWRFAYKDAEYIKLLIHDELMAKAATHSVVNDEKLVQVMDDFKFNYEEAIAKQYHNPNDHTSDELLHTALDVALKMPDLQGAVPFVVEELRGSDGARTNIEPLYGPIAGSAQRYGLGERLKQNLSEVLQRTYDCAKTNPAVKKVVDKRHAGKTKSKIDDSAKEIATNNPENPVLQDILQRVGENGTLSLSLNELKAMSKTEFDKINHAIGDLQQTLVGIDKQQKDLLQYMSNQEAREVARAIAAAKAAEYELTIKALNSSVSIISTLADFIRPGLGKQMSTILGSGVVIVDSMTRWLDAVAGLNGLDKLTSLSTVVMTGNVLGAVMNVVSLFGDAEPTPDQMILEEIGKLRQQVDRLRTEMHDRFDRIDQELNTIYAIMQDRFNLIDVQLGEINGNIQEVQKSLIALDLKLSRIERNNFEFLDALGRRPLLNAINGGLGYQDRTGLPMPFQPDFIEYENVLQTWGTIHAFDALATGPTQRDYSAGALLTELNAYPLDSNLNYLNGWLIANGYPAISNKRLPSPRDWLFATRAYTQLGQEWPAHMKQIDPQRHTQLNAISADMEAAMLNISTRNTLTGTLGNTLLFTNVITYYQGKLNQLDGQIQQEEAAYAQEIRSKNGIDRQEPFNLYGGIDQALTYTPPGLNAIDYDASALTLTVPSNLMVHIPNFNRYNLAEYLKITTTAQLSTTDQLQVAIDVSMQNRRPVPGCKPDPDVCAQMGNLSVGVGVFYGNVSLVALELLAGRVILPVIDSNVEEPIDYVVRNWAGLKPRFEAEASIVAPSPALAQQRAALLSDLSPKLEERLAAYQQALYRQVLQAMTTGSLRPFAVELAGGKTLLDSFVTLGLSRAVGSDDFLRAMLYGDQQLINDNQIAHTYALSITQPITGTNLTINPRLVIGQVAEQRTTAFTGIINRYLAAITANTHVEASDYVANARRELDLTMRIAQLDGQPTTPPPSTDKKQIYLPLIVR